MNSVKTNCVQTLYLLCQNRSHENKPTFSTFLDIEKAFDRVIRDIILLRLQEYGINRKMYNSIKKMFDDKKSILLNN